MKNPLSRFHFGPRFWAGIIVLVLVAFGIRVAYTAGATTYKQAYAAFSALNSAVEAARITDWEASAKHAQTYTAMVAGLEETLDRFAWLDSIPGTSDAVQDASAMLGDSRTMMNAYAVIALRLEAVVQLDENQPLENEEQRAALMAELDTILPAARVVSDSLSSLLDTYEGSLWERRFAVIPLMELRQMHSEVRSYLDAATIAHGLMTAQPQATYLVLLQNNTELRPTGGFIGTYGIVTVDNGEIKEIFFKDVYSLDERAPQDLNVPPPAPLKQYFNRERLYVRDANWDPDFPTAAKNILALYYAEGGAGRIEGVIAVTPEFAGDLLDVLGPVTVEGVTYTRQNFVDALQYEVEVGYIEDGKPKAERKVVVDTIGRELIRRLYALPVAEWERFDNRLMHNLDRKHVQVYVMDTALQAIAARNGWDGALAETDGDYVAVIDANLGSFKTDPAVERTIAYTVEQARGEMVADIAVTYRHTAVARDWKTSHYRTYTRVYVPAGSELLEAWGGMRDDSGARGEIDVTDEFGKTAFGAFVAVNPGETKTLRYRYRLPATVTAREAYRLLLQKQAGNSYTSYHVALPVGEWAGELEKDVVFE